MKESEILLQLEALAEQLDVTVSHVNMRNYSYGVKSGLCRVKGEHRVIIDRHLHLSEKIDVLIDSLQNFEFDCSDLDPAVSRLLKKRGGSDSQQVA